MFQLVKQPFSFTLVNKTFSFDFLGQYDFRRQFTDGILERIAKACKDTRALVNNNWMKSSMF